jgi:F-type H+-transporting ATPase subunit gamma
MPSIKDLKTRITSVKNTQQTTKAMKMVSAAKLRRATDAILSQRPYAQEVARMMAVLADQGAMASATGASRKPATLLVVVTSDRGLCGGYNGGVARAAASFIADRSRDGREVKAAFVGKKGLELVRARTPVNSVHFEEFGAKITFKRAAEFAKKILPFYENGEVDEVVFVYSQFKNAITQQPVADLVLPIGSEEAETGESARNDLTIFEPSKLELYRALSAKYFVIQVFKAFLEAQASEHGARMSAMENATKNAGDMIRRLTLQFNKQRQAAITKELLEIISGSESQKVQA